VFIELFNHREYVSLSQVHDSDFVDVNLKAIEIHGNESHQVFDQKIKVNKNDVPFELRMFLRHNYQNKTAIETSSSHHPIIKITKQDILNLKRPQSFEGLFDKDENIS